MAAPDALPFCLCLAGPTASGKTAAALAIAQEHACEIISVDSALVYRGMDIGTAKPSALEQAQVPHHLIDIRDPLHAYSAADFVRDAQRLIRDIAARGKLPLLVGGTMLYFKALFDGLDDMPAANPAVRAELEAASHRERLARPARRAGLGGPGYCGASGATGQPTHPARTGGVSHFGLALVALSCHPECYKNRSWSRRFHEG